MKIVSITSLREIYNVGNYTTQNNSTSISIASYLEEYANIQDYDSFLSTNVPYMNPNGTFTVTSISGGENLQNLSLAGGEANLDTQYAFGLVGDAAQKTVFTTAGRPPFFDDNLLNGTNSNEPYLDFVTYLLADNYTATLPQVISTSYGMLAHSGTLTSMLTLQVTMSKLFQKIMLFVCAEASCLLDSWELRSFSLVETRVSDLEAMLQVRSARETFPERQNSTKPSSYQHSLLRKSPTSAYRSAD